MGISFGRAIPLSGLMCHLNPGNPSSYPGSGSTIKDLRGITSDSTIGGLTSYDSTNRLLVGTSNLTITIPYSSWMNTVFESLNSSWSIIQWTRSDDLTYPRAADGGVVNTGYGATTTRGFDWNHGVGNLSTIRFAGSAGTDVNAASTGYDFDNTLNLTTIPSSSTVYCRALWWDRSTNTCGAFINGVDNGSVSMSTVSGFRIYSNGDITLGTLYGWQHIGRKGSVLIYNRKLSADEYYTIYLSQRLYHGAP